MSKNKSNEPVYVCLVCGHEDNPNNLRKHHPSCAADLKNKDLSIAEQDRIAAEGASSCRSPGRDKTIEWWLNNPYPKGTVRHEIWQAGFETEAECEGTVGRDI